MRKLEERVELCGSAYYNMLRSVIEPFPRECTGDLLGKKRGQIYYIFNSYPIQTSERKFKEVSYSDDKAVKRVRKLNKAVNKLGGLGTGLIGGYHPHNQTKRDNEIKNTLGQGDIDFIQGEIDELKKNYWIEIILMVKERKYLRKREIGEIIYKNNKRLRVGIIDDEYHGYNITFSAFKLERNGDKLKKKLLKVRRRILKIKI